MEEIKITSMIPAVDWWVGYWLSHEPFFKLVPLLSFVLLEDNTVSGLDKNVKICQR